MHINIRTKSSIAEQRKRKAKGNKIRLFFFQRTTQTDERPVAPG
jgi:hypothetical protein